MGVGTNGTNDGGSQGDPYVFPLEGKPYKLPDVNTNYCLYADKNTFITASVKQLTKQMKEEIKEFAIKMTGSDENDGAKIDTTGYFFNELHINTSNGQLYLNLETKQCNVSKEGVFNVEFSENILDAGPLYKNEIKMVSKLMWEQNGQPMAIDVSFYGNPQIRNGITLNTIGVNSSSSVGLLVKDYSPELLATKSLQNKLSTYQDMLDNVTNGKRVDGDNLVLKKHNEKWTQH
tara:strand:- start:310 stop:1008 length:699 start_codon:yes stop_codon:yes gene_type:complete